MEQRFTLPNLPLHRDLLASVSIGTQFSVRATPIDHEKRSVTFTLVTDKSEAALEITLHLPDKHGRGSKLRALSRSATAESSAIEKEVSSLAVSKEFVLGVIVKEHVYEIYLDTIFLLPFVHRVNPTEVKKLVLDGAMICNEVVVVPVKTEMPPLPQYNEVSLNRQQAGPAPQPAPRSPVPVYPAGTAAAPTPPRAAAAVLPAQPLQPTRAPPAAGAVPVLPPYPAAAAAAAGMQPPVSGGSVQKMPEPRPAPPPADPIGAGALPLQPMQQPQQLQPSAAPVAPMPYDAAPLPQAYPHNPFPQQQQQQAQGPAPQFQNVQPIPGLSYGYGQQQPQQPPYQTPYPQMQQSFPQMQQMQQQQMSNSYPPMYPQYGQQPYPNGYYNPAMQYQYPAYPSAYTNSHCHYDYYHHHHC